MEEQQTQETLQQQQPQEAQPEQQSHGVDWKKESRKWEERSKKNYQDLTKLQEENEASKKELQDLKTSLEEITQKFEQVQQEQARTRLHREIAQKTGLPESVVSMLNAQSSEELEAQAQTLKQCLPLYPSTHDTGAQKTPALTVDDVLSEKDPEKRKRLIAQNIDKF